MESDDFASTIDKEFLENARFILDHFINEQQNLTYAELVDLVKDKMIDDDQLERYIKFLKLEEFIKEIHTRELRIFVSDEALIRRFLGIDKEIDNLNVWTGFGIKDPNELNESKEAWIDTIHKRPHDFIFDGTYLKDGEFFHFHGFEEGSGPKIILTRETSEFLKPEDIKWIEEHLQKNEMDLFMKEVEEEEKDGSK